MTSASGLTALVAKPLRLVCFGHTGRATPTCVPAVEPLLSGDKNGEPTIVMRTMIMLLELLWQAQHSFLTPSCTGS
jgi:hypothetical protein